MPYDRTKLNSVLDSMQNNAQSNAIGTQGVDPEAAAQAIADEQTTGIPASIGMLAPKQDNSMVPSPGEAAISNPHVVQWMQHPAQAAAAQGDHQTLGSIADKLESIPVVGDFLSPAIESARGLKRDALRYYEEASTPRFPQSPVEMIPGFNKQDQILGSLAGNVLNFIPQVAKFEAASNAVAGTAGRLLQDVPQFDVSGKRLSPEEAKKNVQDAVNLAAFGLTRKGVKLGTVSEASAPGKAPPVEPAPAPEPPPKAMGTDGLYPVDEHGFMANENGLATQFTDAKEAALWARSNTAEDPRVFTPDLHPETKTVGLRVIDNTDNGFSEPPAPGVDPVFDEGYKAHAKETEQALKDLEEQVTTSKLHERSPAAMEKFTEQVAPEQTITIAPGAYTKLAEDPKFLDFLEAPENQSILDAFNKGYQTGIELPLSTYLAKFAGTPWADVLRPAVSANGGISSEAAKELKSAPAMAEGSQAPSPSISPDTPDYDEDVAAAMGISPGDFYSHQTGKDFPDPEDLSWDQLPEEDVAELKKAKAVAAQAVNRVVKEQWLGGLFADPKTLDISAKTFGLYSEKGKAALDALKEKLWKRTFTKVKSRYTKQWKESYDHHFPQVSSEILGDATVRAEHGLRFSVKAEFNDLVKDNAFVHDGQPITFYHASTHSTTGTPQNPWMPKKYNVISFSTDPKFVNRWAESWEGGSNFNAAKEWNPGEFKQERAPTQYVVHLKAKRPGDFRNEADVQAALKWHQANGGYATAGHLREGSWTLWERPEMWKALGWDGAYMKESPESALNACVANGEQIFFKYVERYEAKNLKLSHEVKKLYHPGLWDKLPNSMFSADGQSADEVASEFGFDSGHEMLRKLAAFEYNKGDVPFRKHIVDLIKTETRLRTLADVHGITPDDVEASGKPLAEFIDQFQADQILADAKELFAEPEITDLLIDELKHLAGDGYTINRDQIKGQAVDNFLQLPLKNAMKIRAFELELNGSWKKIEKLLLEGKTLEAIREKQRQVVTHLQLIEAHKIVREVKAAQKNWTHWAKSSTLANTDQEWLNWVHDTLRQLGYNVKRNAAELRTALGPDGLEAFAQSKRDQGYGVLTAYIPAPDETMTVEMFKGLDAMLKNFMHNGKEEGKAEVNEQKEDLAQLTADISGNFDKIGRNQSVVKMRERGPRGTAGRMARGGNAWMIQPERLLEEADGAVLDGPLVASVDRPMQDAMVWKQDKLKELGKELTSFIKSQPKVWQKSLKQKLDSGLTFDNEPIVNDRGELIRFMLNLGNDGNREKLFQGYSMTPEQGWGLVHTHATKADWDFVQKIWDMHEGLWPKIDSEYRALYGVPPTKVVPVGLETAFGNYAGGYYPVSYDWLLAEKMGMPVPRRVSDENPFGREYVSAFPSNPYTKGRTNYYAPILLNFDTIMGGLNATIHDLAFRRALIQANKIINHPVVKKGFIESFGPEYLKQLQSWIKYVAHESLMDEGHAAWVANFLRTARVNMSNVGLMYRMSTVALHGPIAFLSTVAEADKLLLLRAMADLYAHPNAGKTHDFITENSGEIRHRMRNVDRDINDSMKELLLKQGFVTEFQKYGYHALGWSDQFSARPAWLAYYRKMLGEEVPHEEAAKRADQFVRQVHGSGSPVNLAGVQRGGLGPHGELGKFATLYTSFLNHTYNRNWRYGRMLGRVSRKAQEGDWQGARTDFTKSMSYYLWAVVGGMIWYQFEKGTVQGQERAQGPKGYIAGLLHNLLGGVPLANSAIEHLEELSSAKGAAKFVSDPLSAFLGIPTLKDVVKLVEGKDVSPRWLQHAMETTGYWSGMGLGGPGLTAQYLFDVTTGKEKVESFQDFVRGIWFGPRPGKGHHKSKVNLSD